MTEAVRISYKILKQNSKDFARNYLYGLQLCTRPNNKSWSEGGPKQEMNVGTVIRSTQFFPTLKLLELGRLFFYIRTSDFCAEAACS